MQICIDCWYQNVNIVLSFNATTIAVFCLGNKNNTVATDALYTWRRYLLRYAVCCNQHNFFIKDSNRFYSYLQGDNRWQNFEMLTLCPLTLDFLNPKSIGFNTMSRTTTLPSFKSLRWGGGCFIMVTYSPHNYPHTRSDKVIAISVLPCYVVGADNHSVQAL